MVIGVLVFSAIGVMLVTALVSWSITSNTFSNRVLAREQSLQIAEAGIEYSRWYLAHFQTGYTLGNSGPGPYVYTFNDKNGTAIGTYTITVTPPLVGSTLVRITSKGETYADPDAARTIAIQLAIPSLAKYAVVANDTMRFGLGTEIFGPLHSNGGIRFDGIAWNKVTSALADYDDPDHTGNNEFGVHTHVVGATTNDTFRASEAPPQTVPVRTDVFKAGREFPVPAVDFTGIISDLATIKTEATTTGNYYAASGAQGYLFVLKTDDTYDVYRVQTLTNAPSGQCKNDLTETGWGTWSVQTKTFLGNHAFPTNGLIFAEDNVWVEGTIDGTRLTIGAAKFPDNASQRKSITVNNDLLYVHKDGTEALALIAQNNINIGMVSDTDIEIDAALVAQNGRVGRYYYNNSCFPYNIRSSATLFGMIATNKRYGFAFTNGTGYTTRTIIYDASLLYSPPPNFPLAADNYQIISWDELEH